MSYHPGMKTYSSHSFYRSLDQEREESPGPFAHYLPRSPNKLAKPKSKRQKMTIDLVTDSEDDEQDPAEKKSVAKICSLDQFEVSDRSLRTLGPRRMLNDDIVHFYMKHVLTQTAPDKRDNVHVFNCFFYQKFKGIYMDSLKKKVTQTFIEQEVRRWEKGVKIFDKDFLVIPVCEQLHWNLVIVAYPGLVQAGERRDDEASDRAKRPAVLIFDSLKLKYMSKFTGFIRNIFLKYRWKLERPKEKERYFENRDMLTERYALVPKQNNYYDCGIHMLNSFEMFLKYPRTVYRKVMDVENLRPFEVDTDQMRERIKDLLPKVDEI